MSRSTGRDGEAGATLLEVLLTLVVLTLLAGVVVMSVPRVEDSTPPSAERALAFLRSAQASAISTGRPVWLSVSHDTISDDSSSVQLAAGTVMGPDTGSQTLENVMLLVQADGLIVGPRLRLQTTAGARELVVWQPVPRVGP